MPNLFIPGGIADGTSSIIATGAISPVTLGDRFASPTMDVRGFMPNSVVVWGASANSRPLSGFFGSLAAAQAVYPFATSLAQEVDQCAVQLAHDKLYASGGGEIVLPPGAPKFNFTLVVKADRVAGMRGAGATTLIDAGGCCDASVPAIRVTGAFGGGPGYAPGNFEGKLSSFAIKGRNNGVNPGGLTQRVLSADYSTLAAAQADYPFVTSLSQPSPGHAATGFVPGSVAIQTDNLFCFVYRNITISLFDKPTAFGDNCFLGEFAWCTFTQNNYGVCSTQAATRYNSGENFRWIGGSYSNNNYNIWIDCTTADNNITGGSYTVSGGSCDYWYVRAGVYDGGAGDVGYCANDLTLTEMHIESVGSQSGLAAPFLFRQGPLTLRGCKFQWSDGNAPRSLVTSDINIDSQHGSVLLDDVKVFGMFAPLAASPANNSGISFKVEARGCRYPNKDVPVVMFMNSDGSKPQFVPLNSPALDIIAPDGGSYTAVLDQYKQSVGVRGSGNIILPSNLYPNFGWIEFVTTANQVNTFVGDGNSTISPPSGKSASFGGSPGRKVRGTVIYNTWFLWGDLN